jgi:alcohol dehydrogenase YqhD (iron-dependent ADH family)
MKLELSSVYGIPHGAGLVILSPVDRVRAPHCPPQVCPVRQADVGNPLSGRSDVELGGAGIAWTKEWLRGIGAPSEKLEPRKGLRCLLLHTLALGILP